MISQTWGPIVAVRETWWRKRRNYGYAEGGGGNISISYRKASFEEFGEHAKRALQGNEELFFQKEYNTLEYTTATRQMSDQKLSN